MTTPCTSIGALSASVVITSTRRVPAGSPVSAFSSVCPWLSARESSRRSDAALRYTASSRIGPAVAGAAGTLSSILGANDATEPGRAEAGRSRPALDRIPLAVLLARRGARCSLSRLVTSRHWLVRAILPKESARVPALRPSPVAVRMPDRARPLAGLLPVPGQHGRHRRDGERPERRRACPAPRSSIKNTATNLERSLITDADGRFRGAAAAPRPVPGHGQPQGLRHPGAGGHRADRRPVREPGPHPQGLERPGGDRRHGRLARDRDDPDGGRRPHQPGGGPAGCPTTAGTSSTSRSSPRG